MTTVTALVLLWPCILAVLGHEWAHAVAARALGDRRPEISLDPTRYIDLFGTVVVPVITFFVAGVILGWGRAVPVEPGRLRNPVRDMALVAAAGPAANLVMASIWLLGTTFGGVCSSIAHVGVFTNVTLAACNLLPFKPLDGGHILAWLKAG